MYTYSQGTQWRKSPWALAGGQQPVGTCWGTTARGHLLGDNSPWALAGGQQPVGTDNSPWALARGQQPLYHSAWAYERCHHSAQIPCTEAEPLKPGYMRVARPLRFLLTAVKLIIYKNIFKAQLVVHYKNSGTSHLYHGTMVPWHLLGDNSPWAPATGSGVYKLMGYEFPS